MLIVHGSSDSSSERQAGERLGQLACDYDPDIGTSSMVVLEIFPSVQCFGQKTEVANTKHYCYAQPSEVNDFYRSMQK